MQTIRAEIITGTVKYGRNGTSVKDFLFSAMKDNLPIDVDDVSDRFGVTKGYISSTMSNIKCHPDWFCKELDNYKATKKGITTQKAVVTNPAESFSFLSDIMGLASKAGGIDRLNEIIEPLSEVSEQVGGIGQLKKMIGALASFKAA